jgi:hypothetical protein
MSDDGGPNWERLEKRLAHCRESGHLARAEELLQAWCGTLPYRPWVWAELGSILLARGDLPGAGRALFWAGVRGAAAAPAITEYLRRYGKHPRQLLSSIPRHVRAARDQHPQQLRDDLRALGVRDKQLAVARGRDPAPTWWSNLVGAAIVLTFVAVFAVGAYHSIRMLWGWLRSLFG